MLKLVKKMLISIFLLCSFTLGSQVNAEQKIVVGNYEVHYIGLNTAFLSEEVARSYQIQRSKKMGYLSISVLKKTPADVARPIKAKVVGSMTNLLGQTKPINFKLISEPSAWYQIATFRFDERDLYRIQLEITPVDTNRSFHVQFKQAFYAN